MQITDPQGQSLTPEDLAFFDAHPHLARLAVKAHTIERDPALTESERQITLLLWACELLDLDGVRDDRRWAAWAAQRSSTKQSTDRTEGEKIR